MKKVLFFAPFGGWAVHHQLDAVLASAMHLRGSEVAIVGCDGVFDTCHVLAWKADEQRSCLACAKQGKALFEPFQFPVLQLRDYLSSSDFDAAQNWSIQQDVTKYSEATFNGLPIGEWVTSSVLTHLRITPPALHEPATRRVHLGYLKNGVLCAMATARILEKLSPDTVVLFNGRIAPYRIAAELALSRGIRILGHERGWQPSTFCFFENHTCSDLRPLLEKVEAQSQVSLSAEQCGAIRDYFRKREIGTDLNHPSFYTFQTEALDVRRLLHIPPEARILCAFSSSEFEIEGCKHLASPVSQLGYLDALIEAFRNRPDYLVIRHHPHIAGTKEVTTDYSFMDAAYEQARRAPSNVRVVMPSEKLSSYALMWQASGAIAVYSSTVMEAAARGVAGAVSNLSYYTSTVKEVLSPDNLHELGTTIDSIFEQSANFGPEDLRPSYRYCNSFLDSFSYSFQSIGIKDFYRPDLKFASADELRPGQDATLDAVCEFIELGTPLPVFRHFPGTGSYEAEQTFFEAEIAELRLKRARIKSESHLPLKPGEFPVAVLNLPGSSRRWQQRSRFQSIVNHELSFDTTGENWRDELRRAVALLKEDFVLLASPQCEYDESFVNSAVIALLPDPQLDGVTAGAFLTRDHRKIESEVFTRTALCEEFTEALDIYPLFARPEHLLSLCLFRKAGLLKLLDSLPSSTEMREQAARIFSAIRADNFIRFDVALISITDGGTPQLNTAAPFDVPILLTIFNRPDLTQQVFEKIRELKPARLYVAADGPRRWKPDEKVLCEETRNRILNAIDWECEVQTLFRNENLGCKRAMAGAISWFFSHVEEGIILEDDCLPDPTFFSFCREMLAKYRDQKSVMHIGGSCFAPGSVPTGDSYYFSKYTHIWGWATWRRAWRLYDPEIKNLENFLESSQWVNICPDPRERDYWAPAFRKAAQGLVDTWDYQWLLCTWQNDGLAIAPARNLVRNLGFRPDATHTPSANSAMGNLRVGRVTSIQGPALTAVNTSVDEKVFETVFYGPALGSLAATEKSRADAEAKRELKNVSRQLKRLQRDFEKVSNEKEALAASLSKTKALHERARLSQDKLKKLKTDIQKEASNLSSSLPWKIASWISRKIGRQDEPAKHLDRIVRAVSNAPGKQPENPADQG